MKVINYPSTNRGHAEHGWLKTYYSFSFADFYNPNLVNFGKLRVINDDRISPAEGFGTHPHDNMEIITIPLQGALEHKDSMGHVTVIHSNEVQVMSAGTGIYHSEYNHSDKEDVTLFQIWIFPKEKNVEPRYDQLAFNAVDRINKQQLIVCPDKNEKSLWINQDAWLWLSKPDKDFTIHYQLHDPNNGLYVMVIEGQLTIDNNILNRRDAIGLSEFSIIDIHANAESEVLLIEIPMK